MLSFTERWVPLRVGKKYGGGVPHVRGDCFYVFIGFILILFLVLILLYFYIGAAHVLRVCMFKNKILFYFCFNFQPILHRFGAVRGD